MLIPSWLKMNLGAEVFRTSQLEDKNNTAFALLQIQLQRPKRGLGPQPLQSGATVRIPPRPGLPAGRETRGPEHVVSVLVAPKGWGECGRNAGDRVFHRGGPSPRQRRPPSWHPVPGCWTAHPRVTP